MRLTSFLRFSVTQTLERKRSKIKAGRTNFSVVFAKSTVSGAKVQRLGYNLKKIVKFCLLILTGEPGLFFRIRSKDEDKLEFMWWDPQVQKEVLFVEDSKVRTVPESPLKKYWPEFLPTRHENVTTLRAESPTCYHRKSSCPYENGIKVELSMKTFPRVVIHDL